IISAEFFLTVKDTPEAKVGYLDGHIVDKKLRTGMLDADLRPKNDWVFQFLDYVRQRGDEAPLGEALSIHHNARGARRPRQANAAALLATRKVVYIDSFQLSKPWRGGGTGNEAFRAFHALLQTFRDGQFAHDVRGCTAMLQCAVLDRSEIRLFNTEEDIHQRLRAFYRRRGYGFYISRLRKIRLLTRSWPWCYEVAKGPVVVSSFYSLETSGSSLLSNAAQTPCLTGTAAYLIEV
ncbi:hypothetical protein LTR53_017786, partial [Teratosphaeriaceae sp. CCFEE 6253]